MKQQTAAAYQRVRNRKAAARAFPTREHFLLREATARAGLRVRGTEVEFYNPYATGRLENHNGTSQWIDVVASRGRRLYAIDLVERDRRYSRRFAEEKRRGLAERGVTYIHVPPGGLYEMESEIIVQLQSEKGGE